MPIQNSGAWYQFTYKDWKKDLTFENPMIFM